MLRGADSRIGRGVQAKPHLKADLARAKGRKLISAYETPDTSSNAGPNFIISLAKTGLGVAKGMTVGYAKEAATNIRHPIRRLQQPNQMMMYPGGGRFDEIKPRIHVQATDNGGVRVFYTNSGREQVFDPTGAHQSGHLVYNHLHDVFKDVSHKHALFLGKAKDELSNEHLLVQRGNELRQQRIAQKSAKPESNPYELGANPNQDTPFGPQEPPLDPTVPRAPKGSMDSADAYTRALSRLHDTNPGFIGYLNRQGSPEAELINALLGSKPVLRRGELNDLAGGFKRKQFVESPGHSDRSLPYLAGDTLYGRNRFSGLDESIKRLKFEEKNPSAASRREEKMRIYGKTPREKGFLVDEERRKALNRVLFNHLYRVRN